MSIQILKGQYLELYIVSEGYIYKIKYNDVQTMSNLFGQIYHKAHYSDRKLIKRNQKRLYRTGFGSHLEVTTKFRN